MTTTDPQASASPDRSGWRRLVVTGANHRTASQELRDALFVEDHALADYFARLREGGINEAIVLATCDRVEVVAIADDAGAAARRLRDALAAGAVLGADTVEGAFFTLTGEDALGHLFAIAASLESQIVGEPEVLGQVKEAHRRAQELGMVGRDLGRVLDAAYGAAKRARTETAIGESAVSIASAAVQVAREVLGRFDGMRALMIGGAEIGVAVAERLVAEGLRDISVADPLVPRADALAARLGAHRLEMAEIAAALVDTDIVLAGLGGRTPVVGAGELETALKARRFRPIFLLDAAVPPDVEGAVRGLDGAYLFDLHDLERIALTGQERRSREADLARAIVAEEAARFMDAEGGRAAAPVVTELRSHFEEVRAQLLREHPGASADEATRLLVNRLLHAPSRALRQSAAGEPDAVPAEAGLIARLFGLSRRRDRDKT